MKKVLVKGPALSLSGYGEQARFALRSLREREDVDLYFINIPWGKTGQYSSNEEEKRWLLGLFEKTKSYSQQSGGKPMFDVSIQVTIPNEFEQIAPINIGYTAGIETTKVAPQWIEKSNRMTKLVVPSKHSKTVFEETLYKGKIEGTEQQVDFKLKVPVDVCAFPATVKEIADLELDVETEWNFLSVAQWGPRKNVEATLLNFLSEFKDQHIGLILKVNFSKNSMMDKIMVENKVSSIVNSFKKQNEDVKCKVYVLHGNLTDEEMRGLYRHPKVKAFITTSHGEGFGLPMFEAAIEELPIIAPAWSAYVDFLFAPKKVKDNKKKNKPHFTKIEYELKRVQKEAVWNGVIQEDSQWCFVKDYSVKNSMRDVFKNYGQKLSDAKKISKFILENFSEENQKNLFNISCLGENKKKSLTEEIKKTLLNIEPKNRLKSAKKLLQEVDSQTEKLEVLKGLMKGEKCYLLSCGPTLLNNDQEKLKDLLRQNVCLSIKQSFNMFEEFVDLHFYNCANFKRYEYKEDGPLVMEASTSITKLGNCDLKFLIQERDFNKSLAVQANFDDWTLEKNPVLRPYGPGIMTEIVVFALEHLGFSEVITVGWDNKLVGSDKLKQHFYTSQEKQFDKKDFIDNNDTNSIVPMENLKHEEKISSDSIEVWYEWLNKHNCQLKICSDINPAPEKIERVTI
jgi:GTP:adenosylcobinamide-phosphate guanylyltransferase